MKRNIFTGVFLSPSTDLQRSVAPHRSIRLPSFKILSVFDGG